MPSPIPDRTLTEALHWRYATKKFDPSRRIPAGTWEALEESLVLSPSSYGLQPWRFVEVGDPGVRARLSAAARGQRQPVDSSHFVVFAVRRNLSDADVDRYIGRVAEVRGQTRDSLQAQSHAIKGSIERARREGTVDTWMTHQVYIALGQFLASAAVLGVDACPMEGLDHAKFDEVLGLGAQGFGTVCAAAAGYRAQDDKYARVPKVRFRAQDVIVRV
ncbi:MAG TPA: NAD(P)H-dependent oxidoreductase [Opitutaceae bacterium]|jgi:nitroreductase